MASEIKFSNVSKVYTSDFWKAPVQAIEDVSFEVLKGSTFGLIGPNGAGKTTSIKILLGLVRPTKGEVLVSGMSQEGDHFKQFIGYLPENAYYYDYLTTEEILDFYGRIFGLSKKERLRKTDELLELVGLQDRKGEKLRGFSKGMLQRIGIAQALINDPSLVILDEPMSGLDPLGRKEVRDIILRLADSGKTVLMSSHILSDVEAVCGDVAILVKGKVRAHGKISDLVQPGIKSMEIAFRGESQEVDPEWSEDILVRESGNQILLTVRNEDRVADALQWGKDQGLKLLSITPQKETLEDLFLQKIEDAA